MHSFTARKKKCSISHAFYRILLIILVYILSLAAIENQSGYAFYLILAILLECYCGGGFAVFIIFPITIIQLQLQNIDAAVQFASHFNDLVACFFFVG